MKMNKEKQEQAVRDIYKSVQTPDSVKNSVEETLNFIKRQEDSGNVRQIKKHSKCLSFKKALMIAAAAILCIGGTVFAAGHLYQIQLNKEKEHRQNLVISSEETLPKEVDEVELKINYMPEGFSFNPDDGKDYYTNLADDTVGYFVGEPALIDVTDPMSVSFHFVRDSDTLTINGRDAIYVCCTYSSDAEWKKERIFILYEEFNRMLCVGSWGHGDKDELIKIAENVTLTPTGNKISTKGLHLWSDVIESEKVWDEESVDASAAYYFNEAGEEQMANVHQIGDKLDVQSFFGDEDMTDIQLTASVTDVQVADNLSLLTDKTGIPEEWKELIGPDEKLIPDTLNYIKSGDGEDTLPEIVRTEESPVKLVYTTVEYSNYGTETEYDVWYMASLISIVKDGDMFRLFDRTDESCDYVENEHAIAWWENDYSDVEGENTLKNYIPEIKPGETVTLHFAWVVNEDELDKLYLDFTGDSLFSEEGLEVGYVDLNL